MLLIIILLAAVLFLFFYTLTGGPLPEINLDRIKDISLSFVLPAGCAVGTFILSTFIFGTPLAGLPWSIMGWFLPLWIQQSVQAKRQSRIRALALDFITSSAGLYSAGQVTPEVIATTANRFPEPLATDFRDMLAQRRTNPFASTKKMFEEMGDKYGLPEFKAFAEILAASEHAGGPQAAARGLKRLGRALRQRDRLIGERQKALVEVKIAATVVIFILLGGLLLDVTALLEMFSQPAGKVVLGLSSGIVVGLIFMTKKITQSPDLA
ncbi:MAG: hypothetical protein A4E53_00066 [Pelotomaculum sp. PtaB.Bin104]|nr:MAG: hypothetical protein A4E53_00066 [Pelotomaculum sp. PtaB.Bin104]